MENRGAVDNFMDGFKVIAPCGRLEFDKEMSRGLGWLTSITVPVQGVLGPLGVLEVMFRSH